MFSHLSTDNVCFSFFLMQTLDDFCESTDNACILFLTGKLLFSYILETTSHYITNHLCSYSSQDLRYFLFLPNNYCFYFSSENGSFNFFSYKRSFDQALVNGCFFFPVDFGIFSFSQLWSPDHDRIYPTQITFYLSYFSEKINLSRISFENLKLSLKKIY